MESKKIMKKFIISVLCVAVFFFGLGSLAEKVGAKFKSDARALELIAKARQAIGGDEAIRNVRSLAISGKTTISFEFNGNQRTEQGNVDIALQLPNQLSKNIRIGTPKGDGKDVQIIEEEKNIVFLKKSDGEQTNGTEPKNVTVNVDSTDGQNGKVIIKKSDGTTEEVKLEGGSQIINTNDGTKVIVRKVDGGSAVFNTTEQIPNGQKVVVNKDVKVVTASGGHGNELLRLAFSLLLSSPEGVDVSYAYAGEETVGGIVCNAINATSAGETFQLFLDKSSNLPVAMNYQSMKMPLKIKIENNGNQMTKENIEALKEKLSVAETATFQVRFSDFRGVNGVQFPYRWETSVSGKTIDTFEISNLEVNPVNIADKLKKQPVKVMKMVKAQ